MIENALFKKGIFVDTSYPVADLKCVNSFVSRIFILQFSRIFILQ